MKLLLVGIISCFFVSNALSQILIDSGFTNKTEAKNELINGVKDGKWVEYSADNKVQNSFNKLNYILTVYKQGKPIGIVREYCNTGEIVKETPYIDGKINGVVKSYYYDGEIKSATPYNDGIINGIKKVYYEHANGKLKSETTYTNGAEIATKNYNENGNEVK